MEDYTPQPQFTVDQILHVPIRNISRHKRLLENLRHHSPFVYAEEFLSEPMFQHQYLVDELKTMEMAHGNRHHPAIKPLYTTQSRMAFNYTSSILNHVWDLKENVRMSLPANRRDQVVFEAAREGEDKENVEPLTVDREAPTYV